MSQERKRIATQLMDAYFQSMPRRNWMHKTSKPDQKPGERMVLYFIRRHTKDDSSGLMVSEIGKILNLTSPTITQHINSLEAQGLVERLADPADRRVVRIRLTEEGERYVQRMEEGRLQMFVELVQHLGEEESVRFSETMKKASEFMRMKLEQYMQHMEAENEKTDSAMDREQG